MLDLTGRDRTRHRRDRRHRRRDCPRAPSPMAPWSRSRARRRRCSMLSAGQLGGARSRPSPCDLADRTIETSFPAAEAAMGTPRHPGQQCRHHPGQSLRAIEGRGLGRGACGRSHRCVPTYPGGGARHDAPPLRPHHRHRLGGGSDRKCWPGQLRRRQGRPDRAWRSRLPRSSPRAAITVNSIAPGFIETAMTNVLADKQKDAILALVPAGRLGVAR